MKKFLAALHGEVWDAVRATGHVTSDGASECADAVEKCVLKLLNTDTGAVSLIDALNSVLKAFDSKGDVLQGDRLNRANRKAIRASVQQLRSSLAGLSETMADGRTQAIVQELAALKDCMLALHNSNCRGLLEDAAYSRSKLIHKKREQALNSELDELFAKYPHLKDKSY